MKTKKMKVIRAYHFVGATLRDGSPVPPDGEWIHHEGKIKLCVSGFHASKDPFDALQYAPAATLCLVECSGEIIEGNDKIVCSSRRIIKRVNVTDLLRLFARKQALSVIHLWNAPDIVREYLETGDESKRAAAWAAARDAAWDAAWDAARDAARAAARDAAWDAAWDAARDAARAAARAAAWDAARDAAWAAARAAAWAAARNQFNDMINEVFSK
jgi:hypothetical protein